MPGSKVTSGTAYESPGQLQLVVEHKEIEYDRMGGYFHEYLIGKAVFRADVGADGVTLTAVPTKAVDDGPGSKLRAKYSLAGQGGVLDKSDGGTFQRAAHTALAGTWRKLEQKLPPQPTEIGDDPDPPPGGADARDQGATGGVRVGWPELAALAGLTLGVIAIVAVARRQRRT